MIGIPAIRHSDTGPVKKSPYELLYIIYRIYRIDYLEMQEKLK